jgi:DNA-binding response OmpR family regulator
MDYLPLDPPTLTDDALLTDATTGPWSSFPGRPRPRHGAEVVRYRGMVMNTHTGSILIQGRPVRLAVKERELLAALMRRSGQIVSLQWLAMQLHAGAEEIDALASALTNTLREAGAQCLPRHVEGLGYVLWR